MADTETPVDEITVDLCGHIIRIVVRPSRSMPEKYDELQVWLERQGSGPSWSTDLSRSSDG